MEVSRMFNITDNKLLAFLIFTVLFMFTTKTVCAQAEIPYNQIDDDNNPNTWDDDLDNDKTCLRMEELNKLTLHQRYNLLGGRQCSRTVADCDDSNQQMPVVQVYGTGYDRCEGENGRCYPGAITYFCAIPKDDDLHCLGNQYGPGLVHKTNSFVDCSIGGKYIVDKPYCEVEQTINVTETNRFGKSGCFNGHDVDCDGIIDTYTNDCSYIDKDGDGIAAWKYGGQDCCDEGLPEEQARFPACSTETKAQINGVTEDPADGIDNNCNFVVDEDLSDDDEDGISNEYDRCNDELTSNWPVDATGCLFSIANSNLLGWSI